MDHMIVLYYLHQLLCEQQSENIKGLITWHFVLGCPSPFYLCCFHSLRKVGASQDLCGLKYVTCFHGHDTKKSLHLLSLNFSRLVCGAFIFVVKQNVGVLKSGTVMISADFSHRS